MVPNRWVELTRENCTTLPVLEPASGHHFALRRREMRTPRGVCWGRGRQEPWATAAVRPFSSRTAVAVTAVAVAFEVASFLRRASRRAASGEFPSPVRHLSFEDSGGVPSEVIHELPSSEVVVGW